MDWHNRSTPERIRHAIVEIKIALDNSYGIEKILGKNV